MKTKISIIISAYNVEKYLDKCLKSVVDNKSKNVEILVINDGSTDNSLEIIQKYLKKFSKNYLKNSNKKAKLIGYKTRNINPNKIPNQIKLYSKIEDLVKDL